MFIYCYDEKLKDELLKSGFKLMKNTEEYSIFVYNSKISFDFNKFSEGKFIMSKKLTFE